ncbi:MAG: hypothetical protein R3B40_14995 [Polyangiales bacterium]|nr:hypothetical protein [Myxococcales bacterium]
MQPAPVRLRLDRAPTTTLLVGLLAGTLGLCAASPNVAAQAPRGGSPVSDYGGLEQACEGARDTGPRRLYQVMVESGDWQFAAYDEGRGALPVDARPSLRVLAGVAAFLPSGLERLEFPVDEEGAATLRERSARGALRVGFFLGFDGQPARACLVRGPATQSLVRGDLAYLELLDADGALVVRAEYDRLRAWADDPARVEVPGEGPRVVFGDPTSAHRGVRPAAAWIDPVRGRAAHIARRCYEPALARGARAHAMVVVRLTVDGSTGDVRAADVELSTLGDAEGARCIADALRDDVRVPRLRVATERVLVRVSVTLVSE